MCCVVQNGAITYGIPEQTRCARRSRSRAMASAALVFMLMLHGGVYNAPGDIRVLAVRGASSHFETSNVQPRMRLRAGRSVLADCTVHYCESTPMLLLLLIALAPIACWSISAALRLVIARVRTFAQYVLLGLALAAGLPYSYYVATEMRISVTPYLLVQGFPLPLAVFHLEQGVWIDYVHQPIPAYATLAVNMLCVMAITLLPINIASAASCVRHWLYNMRV